MPASCIVEPLYVTEHMRLRFVNGSVHLAVDGLDIQRREKTFDRRVGPDVSGTAAGNAAVEAAP